MTNYKVCYLCRTCWCNSKNCEAPKPDCQEVCPSCFDGENVEYTFCGRCIKTTMQEFERQFARKLLPKRIRVEEVKDDEDGA